MDRFSFPLLSSPPLRYVTYIVGFVEDGVILSHNWPSYGGVTLLQQLAVRLYTSAECYRFPTVLDDGRRQG